jgi:ATP phosphoribosyltransferase
MLVIALCKGRFLEPSLNVLAHAGIHFPEDVLSSRKLIFNSEEERIRVVLVKPADVPTYVEYGAADIGIAGRDVLLESRADVLQPLDLKFGYCKIAVAGRNGEGGPLPLGEGRVSVSGFDETCDPHPTLSQRERGFVGEFHRPTIRVATKYPRITMDYYNARGIPVEIIPLSGSIELAPLIGLADRIVDLVETGRTLKDNGLEIVEVIAESSARLLINRAGYQTKREEVLHLIQALEKVIR